MVRKKNFLAASLLHHAPHGSLRFFPRPRRSHPSMCFAPLSFFLVPESSIPTSPCPCGPRARPTSGKIRLSLPIRVTNSLLLFFSPFFTRAFLPPSSLAVSHSLSPFLFARPLAVGRYNAGKKISLKICLTVLTETGPGVLLIMGFLLAPRISPSVQDAQDSRHWRSMPPS